MESSWSAAPWLLMVSVGIGIVLFVAMRAIERYHAGSKIPREMALWHSEVEAACYDVIRSRIYVAECEKRIEELVGNVPADFNPALFQAPLLAKAVEKAMIERAEAANLYPERRFTEPPEPPSDDDPRVGVPAIPVAGEVVPSNVVPIGKTREWIAGQLCLRRVGT